MDQDKCYCFLLRSISCLESKWHWRSFNPSKWKLNKTRANCAESSQWDRKKQTPGSWSSFSCQLRCWGFIGSTLKGQAKLRGSTPREPLPRHCLDLAHRDPVKASNRQDALMGDTPLTRGVWGTRFSDKPILVKWIYYTGGCGNRFCLQLNGSFPFGKAIGVSRYFLRLAWVLHDSLKVARLNLAATSMGIPMEAMVYRCCPDSHFCHDFSNLYLYLVILSRGHMLVAACGCCWLLLAAACCCFLLLLLLPPPLLLPAQVEQSRFRSSWRAPGQTI